MEEPDKIDVNDLRDEFANYLKARLSLIEIQAVEKSTKIISKISAVIIISILLLLLVTFLIITAGLFLGEILNSLAAGFGIITLSILLVISILLIFKKRLIELPIMNLLIKLLFSE